MKREDHLSLEATIIIAAYKTAHTRLMRDAAQLRFTQQQITAASVELLLNANRKLFALEH